MIGIEIAINKESRKPGEIPRFALLGFLASQFISLCILSY
jgi:hypothetical protein